MKIKSYAGNLPDETWEKVATFRDDEIWWLMFSKAQDHSEEWINVKLVAHGKAPLKANYWAVFNTRTGNIGLARDYLMLKEHRPKLFKRVESTLESLRKTVHGGYTGEAK